MNPFYLIYWTWIVWYASWLLSLLWAGRPRARPDLREHGPYQLATMLGLALLFGPPIAGRVLFPLWHADAPLAWAMYTIEILSFAFCWWGRIVLGKLWNGFVSRNENHRIVDRGPYALVRHPIYTGIIAAGFATAIATGTVEALIGAALLLLAFWLKARLEERFLRKELGAASYDAYGRRVPMLVPRPPV